MIVVRDYLETDLDSVNEILDTNFGIKKSNFSSDEFKEIVATVDEKVCGYVLMTRIFNPVLEKYYYWLDYVSVLEEYRGQGVGKEMLEYVENIAKEKGAMYIQLSCGYQRVSAHKLYEKCGFIKRESDLFRKELV